MSHLFVVRVKTGSSRSIVTEEDNGELTVYVHERPVDGQANAAVIKALSKHFGVAKSHIAIVRGQTSRIKHVKVS